MELRFDLNGMVELEQRFGGSLDSAVTRVGQGKRLPVAVEAFTRSLTPAPTSEEIRESIRREGEITYFSRITDGLIEPLKQGIGLKAAALPEPYRSLQMSEATMELIAARWPLNRQQPAAAATRYGVWACLVEANPDLTEGEVGGAISPVQFHALLDAFTQAAYHLARQQGHCI